MSLLFKSVLFLGLILLLLVFLYPARHIPVDSQVDGIGVDLLNKNGSYNGVQSFGPPPPRVFLFSREMNSPLYYNTGDSTFRMTGGGNLINVEIYSGRVTCEAGLVICFTGFLLLIVSGGKRRETASV